MSGTFNVNDRNFFSDENMEAIGVPAEYADWAPGPNEDPSKVGRGRPAGDLSTLEFAEIEHDKDVRG